MFGQLFQGNACLLSSLEGKDAPEDLWAGALSAPGPVYTFLKGASAPNCFFTVMWASKMS